MASNDPLPNNSYPSPKLTRDPSLPSSIPTTSKDVVNKQPEKPCTKKFYNFLYDRNKKTYCNRTCKSWLYIIAYSTIYLIFLTTYALIFLVSSLWIIRSTTDFQTQTIDHVQLLTYSGSGIGLTATPTSETNYPLIWYRKEHSEDYGKYIKALDSLLVKKRRKSDLDLLGPCGKPPYGYGESPCVVIRVNKQFHWAGEPLESNSAEAKIAPADVQRWLKQDKKLWLYCSGHHSYDKEHIGRIRYYPDPPGFEPSLFPLGKENSPVIGIQISNFTMGLSIAVECKLWYVNGPSSIHFMLYVSDDKVSSRTN